MSFLKVNPKNLYFLMPSFSCECTDFEVMVCHQVLEVLKNDSSFATCRTSLKVCLSQLGYELSEEGLSRFVKAVQAKISKYRNNSSKNGRIQGKKKQDEYKDSWRCYNLHADEISMLPLQKLQQKDETIQELIIENENIIQETEEQREKIEEQARELFNLILDSENLQEKVTLLQNESKMEHRGKPYGEVSSKQKLRHISMLR